MNPDLPGYGALQPVGAAGGFASYGATRADGAAVVIRTHVSDLPTPAAREVLRNHRDLLARVTLDGIAPVAELVDEATRCALVALMPAGTSLAHSDLRALTTADVLQFVIDIAPALAELHVHGVGHGGIDLFTLHRPAGRGQTAQLESPWFVGSSPPPHGDIAALARLVATALARGGQRVPRGLERVLEAASTADVARRYRSVVGFARDLERCRDEIRETGLCTVFEPAVDRFALRWRDPMRPVAMEGVVTEVVSAIGLDPAAGPSVVVVEGASGAGRSTVLRLVVDELRRQGVGVAAAQFQPGVAHPLRAPLQLVGDIVADLVDGPASRRTAVESALRERLGDDLSLAVTLLPPLVRLVGSAAPPTDGGALDMRARVERAAKEVVAAFTSVVSPFVAVFDDAEAADAGSLATLRTLTAQDVPLHFVLARRTGVATDALDGALEHLQRRGVPVLVVTVPPLDLASMLEVVAGGLGLDAEVAWPLADALRRRSAGNPGLAIADLQALIADGVVRVEPATAAWTWDDRELGAGGDGIDEIDRRRVRHLPPLDRHVLLAAAVGGRLARPAALAEAVDRPIESVTAALDRLAADQFVRWRDERSVRFHADGLRRAAIESADGGTLAQLRSRLARVILAASTDDHRAIGEGERFDVLELLVGAEHALSEAEARTYVEWCEQAARSAHSAGAYAAALDLQLRAIAQLGPMGWIEQPDRMFELHLRAAENALVIDRAPLVDQLLDTAWAHDPTPLQRVRALRLLGNRWWTRQDQPGGIAEMHSLLRELGEHFPAKVSPAQIGREFLAARWALRQRAPESFLMAPALTDELVRAKLDTMLSAVHLAYTTEPLTHVLLVLRGIRLTARHGVNTSSCYFVAGYGLLLCGLGRNLPLGVRFGEAGLALSERTAGPVRTMVAFAHHGFVRHWGEPLAATVEPLLAEYRHGLTIGRGGYAHSAGAFGVLHAFLAGRPLDDVIRLATEMRAQLERLDERAFVQRLDIVRQAALDLREGFAEGAPLCGPAFDAERWLSARPRRGELAVIVHTLRAHVAMVAGRFEEAAGHVQAAAPNVRMAPGEAIVGIHHHQVALLHRMGVLRGRRHARRSLRLVRRAAAANPRDHAHRLAMVEGVGDAPALAAAAARALEHGHLADHVVAGRLAEKAGGHGWAEGRAAALRAWGADGVR